MYVDSDSRQTELDGTIDPLYIHVITLSILNEIRGALAHAVYYMYVHVLPQFCSPSRRGGCTAYG